MPRFRVYSYRPHHIYERRLNKNRQRKTARVTAFLQEPQAVGLEAPINFVFEEGTGVIGKLIL